jgi:molecular chaperone GrpE
MADARKDEAPEEATPEAGAGGAGPEAAAPQAESPPEDWATRYKYLFADFENFRRRAERDREGITRQARGAMLRELLPILEAFRSARESAAKLPSDDPLRRGMDLLDREWSTFLRHEGVEPVAKVGAAFRPDEAEAVGEAPVEGKATPGAVVEVVQQGYRFFGGLLRPAKVIVGRAAPAAEARSDPVEERSA